MCPYILLIDNLPFECTLSLITVVKMVGQSVANKEEIRAYIQAHSKIGCSLKQIFAEISVVCGYTNVSDDTVRRWKKKFDSWLESSENAPKGQSLHFVMKFYQKSNKLLKEMLGFQYVILHE